ncbi:hypothetical protein G7Y89_g11873 [Cudoniella acicularis]|uniref:Uncharacterized protein n=1 Tax=Cudoniella acicularis TaxID=354080 RepID=A0A8H4RCH4_9HELO|nr:hypothetical protein G7Y89_g11873 [Cudoniella acicularis]
MSLPGTSNLAVPDGCWKIESSCVMTGGEAWRTVSWGDFQVFSKSNISRANELLHTATGKSSLTLHLSDGSIYFPQNLSPHFQLFDNKGEAEDAPNTGNEATTTVGNITTTTVQAWGRFGFGPLLATATVVFTVETGDENSSTIPATQTSDHLDSREKDDLIERRNF